MRLSKALKLMRATENIGVREQAKRIGISPSSLSRIERGMDCDAPSTVKLIVWLFGNDSAQQ